ncbi:uncharacterized protein LOC129242736 [Anastrepha obliqua]|uniref:uncharacterized protein LOC129242736 n=1 Tax=Anastrepha obliqua TaxID=95512 RepID=UPI00240A23F3|nr:uncharacterized protein LOC129242736 [Anastrepha obliqua]
MPPATVVSNTHLCLYTVGLLLIWIIVITTAVPFEKKDLYTAKLWGKNPAQEQRLENSCKTLCGECGCMGFYCGEECLCEYDKYSNFHGGYQKRNSTKTKQASNYECIASMQQVAHTESLPFEVLIQGPSSERFIRTAAQFELDTARAAVALTGTPKKRTTISIYRPNMATQSNTQLQANESPQAISLAAARRRRSTEPLDWFTDFANTLVRPAPLRRRDGSNKKRETQRKEDNVPSEKSNSWFSDHPNRLLRPAPIFRKQKSSKSVNKESEESEENETKRNSQEMSMAPVGEVIKNTIRNFEESGLGEGLRAGLRDGTELLHNTFQGTNLELFPKRFRNDFAEMLDAWLKSQQVTEASMEVPVVQPHSVQPVLMPWFRPVRFLQRVQQALN